MVIRFLLYILIVSMIAGCGCARRQDGSLTSDSVDIMVDSVETLNSDITERVKAMADSVLEGMTLEQRVGQCFMPSIHASDDSVTMRRLRQYVSDMHVGGVVLLKGDVNSAARMSAVGAAADVPLFMSIDAEWGLGMRLKDAPDFPRNGKINMDADEDLLYDYGREVARECRRIGINMVLGPVIDVVENPRGVIGSRSFGNDPERVGDLGVAYARGLESGRVVSVAKHFPGHGSPKEDSHRELPVIHRSLHQLDSVDLYPFKSYVDAGLTGVMVGHLAVPAIDPQSRPAAVSEVVIDDLLRGELGFKGLVLTDALNMKGVDTYDASSAILAGADIVVSPANTAKEITSVIDKIRKGEMPIEVINDRCRRILFHKILSGLWHRDKMPLEGLLEDISLNSDSLYRRLSN